mmetsp:Transcript_94981/g.290534  ORF Transcript_94981/g.290534 Transcript_94981/m.290534 type:complete len:231 (-) Transcript_94981:56-748(-)
MTKPVEILAIVVSICSVASSALYTYVYVRGQQAAFFSEIHREYASEDIMKAFDTLESFLDATGPEAYATEYVRLKNLRVNHFFKHGEGEDSKVIDAAAGDASRANRVAAEAELGQRLDASRRRLLHYFGKLLMFNRLTYLTMFSRLTYVTQEMLQEFPGRSRAAHAVKLLQPLVEATAAAYQTPLEEHRQILAGIRNLYGLPEGAGGANATDGETRTCPAGEACADAQEA